MKAVARLPVDNRATTTLEFGILASTLLLCLFFIIGSALLLWTKAAIQDAAFQTARCVAVGSPDCSNAQAYATTVIGNWGATGFLQSITVSTQTLVTCSNPAGQFSAVAITGALTIGTSLNGMQFNASACFPSGT